MNALLNFDSTINHCPTVDFEKLKAVLTKQNFTAHLKSFDAAQKNISIMIYGKLNSVADEITFSVDMFLDTEINEVTINGYSISISETTWDSYHVVKDNQIVEDNLISDLIEQLFIDLNLFAIAKFFFVGSVFDIPPDAIEVQ